MQISPVHDCGGHGLVLGVNVAAGSSYASLGMERLTVGQETQIDDSTKISHHF